MYIIPCSVKNLRICRHDLLGLFDEPACFRVWKYIGNILSTLFLKMLFSSIMARPQDGICYYWFWFICHHKPCSVSRKGWQQGSAYILYVVAGGSRWKSAEQDAMHKEKLCKGVKPPWNKKWESSSSFMSLVVPCCAPYTGFFTMISSLRSTKYKSNKPWDKLFTIPLNLKNIS